MTHSIACNLCYRMRQQGGRWQLSGSNWAWIPTAECNYTVVNLGNGNYSVELAR